MESMMHDLLDRIYVEACRLAQSSGRKTLYDRDIKAAAIYVLNKGGSIENEKANKAKAIKKGNEAIERYKKYEEKKKEKKKKKK